MELINAFHKSRKGITVWFSLRRVRIDELGLSTTSFVRDRELVAGLSSKFVVMCDLVRR